MTKKKVLRSWRAILSALNNPPIRLLSDSEWKSETGCSVGSCVGRSVYSTKIITTRYRKRMLIDVKKTLWHEVGHILFPSKPHWWIERYGQIMSKNHDCYCRYAQRYNHSAEELPPRAALLRLSKAASLRVSENTKQIVQTKALEESTPPTTTVIAK